MFPNWAATQAENTNVTLGKHIFKAGFDSGFSLKVSDSHINMKPIRWNWLSVSSAVIKHCYGLQKDSCRVLWLTLYFFLCSFFSIFSFNLTTIFVKYSGQLMAVKLLAFGFNVHFSQKEGFFSSVTSYNVYMGFLFHATVFLNQTCFTFGSNGYALESKNSEFCIPYNNI